jgi:dipeptidyl aminopeptidase/acylaminoacyl peptidase
MGKVAGVVVRRNLHRKLWEAASISCCGFLLLAGVSGVARTQTESDKGLRIEDNLSTRYFAEYTPIVFSPDGKEIAYTIRSVEQQPFVGQGSFLRTGAEWYSQGTGIYLVDVDSGVSRRLTPSGANHWLPVWSADGKALAFLSDADGGQAKLWLGERESGRIRKVSDLVLRSDQLAWSSDGRAVFATALPGNLTLGEFVRRFAPESEQEGVTNAKQSGEISVYRSFAHQENSEEGSSTAPWNLDRYLRSLVRIDVVTGSAKRVVEDERIAKFSLSPAGDRVAYTSPRKFEKAGSQQIRFDLVTVELATGKRTTVAADIALDYDGAGFTWSPDGKHLPYLTGGPGTQSSEVFVVAVDGSAPRKVAVRNSAAWERGHTGKPLWGSDGKLYFLRGGALWHAVQEESSELVRIAGSEILQIFARGPNQLWVDETNSFTVVLAHNRETKEEGLFRVDLHTSKITKLLGGAECFACGSPYQTTGIVGGQRNVAFLREDARHAPDLWLLDPRTGFTRKLTTLNPQLDPEQMGTTRLVEWTDLDGRTLHGALLLPPDYHEGQRCPLVVFVYAGGLLSEQLNHFGLTVRGPLNMQLLATRGYAVLFPDSPQRVGTPMTDVFRTVMPGVTKMVELGIADPERLGVIGFSNGGYSTFALLVQTGRFNAAVVINGPADLFAAYGEMNKSGAAYATAIFEHGLDALGGTPWEYRERYIENSPIHYFDRISTPLLLLQGAGDIHVQQFLGDEAFVGLRRLGKEVEYAKYPGESHDPMTWSRAHQKDLCERYLRWFNVNLSAKTAKERPEKSPGAH